MGSFGGSAIYIFISVFGGSTLLLFLICFCCQRKLQARTLAMADLTNVESQQARRATRNQRRSDTHQLIAAIITPPPDYNTVIKKDSICEPGPPTYEVAMSGVRADGHM